MKALRRHLKQNRKKQATKRTFNDRYGRHKKLCSCAVCGNPRKYGKGKDRLTIQELKHVPNLQTHS